MRGATLSSAASLRADRFPKRSIVPERVLLQLDGFNNVHPPRLVPLHPPRLHAPNLAPLPPAPLHPPRAPVIHSWAWSSFVGLDAANPAGDSAKLVLPPHPHDEQQTGAKQYVSTNSYHLMFLVPRIVRMLI